MQLAESFLSEGSKIPGRRLEGGAANQHQPAPRPAAGPYSGFLVEVKERIRRGQYEALKAVNKELLSLYWDLGETIHQKQEALGWGKSVVENLAKDLQTEFPGRNGFSARNL